MRSLRRSGAHRALTLPSIASVLAGPIVFTVLMLGGTPELRSEPLFGAPSFETGYAPISIAIADLDGDGIQDLATANSGENSISVLLGTGQGGFALPVHYAGALSPQCVAVGDVNGDGRPDLISANRGSNSISILMGIGGGSFGGRIDLDTRFGPYSVAAGDLNRDGKLDIVSASVTFFSDYETGFTSDSSRVGVFLGNGDGSFGPRMDFVASAPPRSIAIGDLNSDGLLDVALANFHPDYGTYVSIMLGNGDGSLRAEAGLYGIGLGPSTIAIGDLNGDGKPDLVATSPADNRACVLMGNGDGTLSALRFYDTGPCPMSVVIADLNRDNRLDLVTVNSSRPSMPEGPSTISVLLGNGDGTFGPRRDFGTGYSSFALGVADLNADGALDVAVASYHTVAVMLGNGAGAFADKTDYSSCQWPRWVAVGDVNGDHKADLVTAGSLTVSVSLGNDDGRYPTRTDCGSWAYPGVYAIALTDLNGDGRDDIVATNASRTVSALVATRDGSWSRTEYPTLVTAYSVGVGDFNGDARPDVVAANYDHPSTASIWLGVGDGTLGPRRDYGLGNSANAVTVGDFNRDGHLDVVSGNCSGNPQGSVSVLLGNGDGSFRTKNDFPTGWCPQSVTAADLNADGRLDLITGNEYGTASVLLGTGDGRFSAPVDYVIGGSPRVTRSADVNGDGKLDLVASNFETHTVQVLLGIGDGTFGPRMDFAASGWPTCVAVGDLNHDGRVDLAVSNQHSSTVSILLNREDAPVPALAAVLSASAAPGRVDLKWYVGLDATVVTVYRRTRTSGWTAVGQAYADGSGEVGYVDASVGCGEEYGYCLGIPDASEALAGEVWVQVPFGYQLSLEGPRPNPAVNGLAVAFSLAQAGPGQLELYDVAGRRVLSQNLEGLGPGPHVLTLDSEKGVRPGVYWLRLVQGKHSLTRRAVVLQ